MLCQKGVSLSRTEVVFNLRLTKGPHLRGSIGVKVGLVKGFSYAGQGNTRFCS